MVCIEISSYKYMKEGVKKSDLRKKSCKAVFIKRMQKLSTKINISKSH